MTYLQNYTSSEKSNGAVDSVTAQVEMQTANMPTAGATATPSGGSAKSVATKRNTLGKSLGNENNGNQTK